VERNGAAPLARDPETPSWGVRHHVYGARSPGISIFIRERGYASVDHVGSLFRTAIPGDCFGNGPGAQACLAWMHSMYKVVITYQPAGRFWILQFWELGIYLALAVALAAFCAYWIRTWVS
jgi:hypothetical protein